MAAVKIMDAVLDKEEDIKAELNVFTNHAHHPNIVDFHGAFLKKMALADDQLWIVMEVSLVQFIGGGRSYFPALPRPPPTPPP